jgi:hypothetical protein
MHPLPLGLADKGQRRFHAQELDLRLKGFADGPGTYPSALRRGHLSCDGNESGQNVVLIVHKPRCGELVGHRIDNRHFHEKAGSCQAVFLGRVNRQTTADGREAHSMLHPECSNHRYALIASVAGLHAARFARPDTRRRSR